MKHFATESALTLLLDEHKYYFRGDHVKGRLVIHPSTKSQKFAGIRLTFYCLVKTYINSKKKDHHYFFKHVYPLPLQPRILKVGKTYTYPFDFILPTEIALPSCTESDTNSGGIIEYVIKATMERSSPEWPSVPTTTSLHVPVLERLNVSQTKFLEPVWDSVTWDSTETTNTHQQDEDSNDTHVDQAELSASIPHQGYIRGQKIPVTVDIRHFQPYQKTKGLTISLIRCTRVLCKEKAYLLPPTIISSAKVDIDVKKTSGQTITQSLLIPRHISPTINLNARLLQVDYRIEVRANLNPQDHHHHSIVAPWTTVPDLGCMYFELPVVIGTLPFSTTSLCVPPDILDPKFVKGVKHVEQDNLPRPNAYQLPSSSSSSQYNRNSRRLCSLTPMNLSSSLLDLYASTNILWDRFTPSSPTTKTQSSTLAVSSSTSSTTKMHKLSPQSSCFRLTLSLGESFDNLVQSSINKQQHRTSLDSTDIFSHSFPLLTARRASEPNTRQPLSNTRERTSSLPTVYRPSPPPAPLCYKPDNTSEGFELDDGSCDNNTDNYSDDDDDDDDDDDLANGCFMYIAPNGMDSAGPFEKPHEKIADVDLGSDSEDDDDDFISILAKREISLVAI
ncbi:hypothetical protein BCR42DRAFT_416634 [Absidia repens]|uniref:Arrestin C-terminal-like domain-containing protein n=1 Tax=Absidia repens TaxID=90262 RepID=A0A1X2IEU8_9FUNG|nr:hypothetical protein BCR42DRAFT_416634 [Absidia repens]